MRKLEHAYFDLDGTLYPGNTKRFSQRMVHALAGIPQWGVNTARQRTSIGKVLGEITPTLPHIAKWGTEVWNQSGELLQGFTLSTREKSQAALTLALYPNLIVTVKKLGDSNKSVWVSDAEWTASAGYRASLSQDDVLHERIESLLRDIAHSSVSLIIFQTNNPGLLDQIVSNPQLNQLQQIGKRSILLKPEGITKGSTLNWVCGELDIDPETMLTAGNEVVDATMFEGTYGVRVGPEVLPNEKIIVPDSEALAQLLIQLFAPNT